MHKTEHTTQRVSGLQSMRKCEQALFCLLGDRLPQSADELASLTVREIATITEWLSRDGLCGYALSRISQLDVSVPEGLIAKLRRTAATEYLTWINSESAIRPLLKIVARYPQDVAMIKGRAVAATVYAAPHLRHSADIDLVVRTAALPSLFDELHAAGFSLDRINSARYCNGPLISATDVLLQPNSEFVSCDELPLTRSDGLQLDLKLDPLESGLRMLELPRFFANHTTVEVAGVEISAPDLVDQLLIACCHFHKDNFLGLRLMLDIHLLARALSTSEWNELERRAMTEGVERSVVVALAVCRDRLATENPEKSGLPPAATMNVPMLNDLVSYRFLWNQNSLPMLLLNAMVSNNRGRKLRALWEAFFPNQRFLTAYYAGGRNVNFASIPMLWFLHAFTIVSPAGVVRRTLGRFLWKPPANRLTVDQSVNRVYALRD